MRGEVAVNCPRSPSSLAEKWKILIQQISLYPCSILEPEPGTQILQYQVKTFLCINKHTEFSVPCWIQRGRPGGRMNHKDSCAVGLGRLTREQCTEPFSKCKSWALFPSSWFPEGNSLPHLPCTDRTGKIMPLSTISSGSVLNKADFSPAEAVFSVSYHEKV